MEIKWHSLWLVAICVIAFILQIAIPGFTEAFLLQQEKPFEIWRFFTAMFLHGDIAHLLYNMLALFFFGMILEKLIGSKKFLLVYFSSGIIANLISINFYSSSLGASGAIFGIIGALIIIRPGLSVFAFGLPMPMFIAGILWAIGDIIGIFVPSGIANIAHLSGMVVGLLLGALFKNWHERREVENKIILNENYVRKWEDEWL